MQSFRFRFSEREAWEQVAFAKDKTMGKLQGKGVVILEVSRWKLSDGFEYVDFTLAVPRVMIAHRASLPRIDLADLRSEVKRGCPFSIT